MTKKSNGLLSRILPVLLWAGVIFLFSANSKPYSALPASWSEPISPNSTTSISRNELLGRVLHTGEYLILAVITTNAIVWHSKVTSLKLFTVFGVCVLYAASDEFHQLFVPGRTAQLGDLALDAFGVLLGILAYRFIRYKMRAKNFIKKEIEV